MMKNILVKNMFSIKVLMCAAIFMAASLDARAVFDDCGESTFGYVLKESTIYFWWDDSASSRKKIVEKSLSLVDVDTFQPLLQPFPSDCPKPRSPYGKDKNHVYYRGEIIEGADPVTFYIFDHTYTKDKNHVFYGTHLISNRVNAFQHVGENSESQYATDGENYYFEGITIKGSEIEILESNPYQYARIDSNMYHQGKLISGADPKSFDAFYPELEIVKDRSHVFFKDVPIPGADAKTFVFVEGSYGVFKDRNSVYFNGEKILNLDPSTVKVSEIGNYLVGDNFVYGITRRDENSDEFRLIKGRDASSFHELQRPWTLDKNGVYYKDKLFPGADQNTFHSIDGLESEDKKFRYVDGRIACKFSIDISDSVPICITPYGER
jgi:hypothetical protein